MALHRFRVFSIEEANRLVPVVADLTERTKASLAAVQAAEPVTTHPDADHDAREILHQWAQEILALGAQPKGVFTVDFRSPDPNLLWCWAPGESEIRHRHFTWESFKDRISVADGDDSWPGRN